MTNHNLTFFVHNQSVAPTYSMPALEAYQSQKNIQVVSNADPLHFGNERSGGQAAAPGQEAFFKIRIESSLGLDVGAIPSYFPGALIPAPGGATCSEIERGNLLVDQFLHLLAFDNDMARRLCQYAALHSSGGAEKVTVKVAPNQSPLFCREESSGEAWLWHYVEKPTIYFLHQAPRLEQSVATDREQALQIFNGAAAVLLQRACSEKADEQSIVDLLTLISDAWFSPSSGVSPVTWGANALLQCRQLLDRYCAEIDENNRLPFLFELEAMASYLSLSEERKDRTAFARGVFAGNFIEVSMAPLTSIKATEFCVRERLFDEVINLSSRGFAPVIINEYGLVADGNHRLTATYVWNILKYCQDLEWSLENDEFQRRVAAFSQAIENGLLKHNGAISPVSLHQALNHLAYFLCRPDWRARLNSYTRPLLKRHDFISELPVVVLPEYLSGAVVKSSYDDGQGTERACPSIYEAMYLNNHLVLPPRASYHFTDAALLPWFTVLSSSTGNKHRSSAFGRRARIIPKS